MQVLGRQWSQARTRKSPANATEWGYWEQAGHLRIRTVGFSDLDIRAEPGCGSHRFLVPFDPPRRGNPETAHLAVQVAPLHAQHFGRARDVALLPGERLENVFPLEIV